MSNTMNLVAKLVLQDKDFVNGLINSRKEMIKFQDKVQKIGSIAKSAFLGFAAGIGIGTTAMESFKKLMRSTEEGADKMERSLHVATTTTDKFFHSIASGSFDSFLKGLKDIVKNAKEAYDALDNLGTMKMWSNARISQLQAAIAEDRVIVNSQTSSQADREAAQGRISENIAKINALSGDLVTATNTAIKAKLREMSGAGKAVTDAMLESYVSMFEAGTLTSEAQKFMDKHSKLVEETFRMYGTNGESWDQSYYKRVWDAGAEEIYNAMHTLATINEETGGWMEYYNLIAEQAAQRTNIAGQTAKANALATKGSGGGKVSVSTPTRALLDMTPTLTPISAATPDDTLQKMDALGKKLAYTYDLERMNAEMALEWQMRIGELTTYADAVNSVANAFSAIGEAMGETPFGKFMSTMGTVAQQIVSLTNTYAQLLAVTAVQESMKAGLGIPFPFNIAMIGAAVTSLFSIISAAKSNFAGAFAEGGIVGGNSYTGDRLFARVNSGEMILNRAQQATLFGNSGGDVHFIIEGSQLKGVLDNYNKISAL